MTEMQVVLAEIVRLKALLQQPGHRRVAGKLVQVWRGPAESGVVLNHPEIQGQYEDGFTERMFTYSNGLLGCHRYRLPGSAPENPSP